MAERKMSLKETVEIQNKESKAEEAKKDKQTAAVLDKLGEKSKSWTNTSLTHKRISAWVDIDSYEKFKQINEKRKTSTSRAISQLITDYTLQYEHLLDK